VIKGIIKISLTYTFRTMKKKGLPYFTNDSSNNLVKGKVLISIKIGNTLCCKTSLLLKAILSLLCNKGILIYNMDILIIDHL
jgi:hypothetical protein